MTWEVFRFDVEAAGDQDYDPEKLIAGMHDKLLLKSTRGIYQGEVPVVQELTEDAVQFLKEIDTPDWKEPVDPLGSSLGLI